MLLLLSCTLLLFTTFSYHPNAQAKSTEETGNGHDFAMTNDGTGQIVLDPGAPRSAGPFPMSANDLINLTTRTYLDPLPANPDISQVLQNVSAELWHLRKVGLVGDIKQINMMVPDIWRCRPVIRGTKRLHSGIACGPRPCSIDTTFTVHENYESTEGYRVETTVSAGVEVKGVSASVSTTTGRNWEKTWGRGSSTSVNYKWELEANGHCTPSMAHVELECDAWFDPVWYDTHWRYPRDRMWLEYTHNRKGGRFTDGQWCREYQVQTTPLSRTADWFPILEDDRYRGLLWKLPSSQMNQFRLNARDPRIEDRQVVIGRVRGRGGDWQEIFVCNRDVRAGSGGGLYTVTVPLSSEAGALEGYIGCVTGPNRGESSRADDSCGEL